MRGSRSVVLALLGLGPLAAAQQGAVEREPPAKLGPLAAEADALVADLRNGDRRGNATRGLLRLGAPGAEALVRGLRFENVERALQSLEVLGEMGPAAIGVVPGLLARVEDCPEPLVPDLYRAVTRILPYSPAGDRRPQITSVQNDLWQLLKAAEKGEYRQRIADEWFRTVQLTSNHGGVEANPETRLRDLVKILGDSVHQYRTELAGELLGRMGAKARSAAEDLLDRLRVPFNRSEVTTSGSGVKVRYPCGPRSNRVIAQAILAVEPEVEAALDAHGYLLVHGLRYQRWNAIMAIRAHPDAVGEAVVSALSRGLEEVKDVEFCCETITTLGILGPAAADAIGALEKLRAHKDKQIAARAAAALRQIAPKRKK